MEAIELLVGVAVLALVFWDVFQTIVVPRPSPGHFRIARWVVPPAWRLWRNAVVRLRSGNARDQALGLFAPGAAVILLAVWLAALVVGYAVVLWALRGEVQPALQTPVDAFYFAGTSLLTLGYGEIVAVGPIARAVVLIAAATGLGVVALVITFLFSLFANYQRREVRVVTLAARAESPPSAVALLETYARLDLVHEIPGLFRDWEEWEADVLDTHVAYPLLGYFRSSHDNASWISALGAVLDAAALVLTTIRGIPRGQAEITKRVGAHLVEDISNNLHLHGDGSAVDLEDFRAVYVRLDAAGYELEPFDEAWRLFEMKRGTYAGRLEALAEYWAMAAPSWVGHRKDEAATVHAPQPASVR